MKEEGKMGILQKLVKSKTARRLALAAMLLPAIPGCGGDSDYVSTSRQIRPGVQGYAIQYKDGGRFLKLQGKNASMMFEAQPDGSFVRRNTVGGSWSDLVQYDNPDSAEALHRELIGNNQ